MGKDINALSPQSGRTIKENGEVINMADILAAVYDAVNGVLKTSASVVLEGSDIQIGAVELKDATTGNRAEIGADGALKTKIIIDSNAISSTNPVPTKNYLSQTQIGSDINFTFANSALVNNQATPIDITKPVSPSQEHEIIVYNPSTVTDLTIKVFSTSLSLSGQTRQSYITSLTVPKSATITGTSIDTYSFFVHGLLNGSNIHFQISNNTVLGGADGFTGTLRIREV